jgi:hypothetical protein
MGVWFIVTGVLGLKQGMERLPTFQRFGLHWLALGMTFALFVYNPLAVIVPPQASAAYQDLVEELKSLDGPVYAPWIGQLQDDYQFYPAVHWVPMTDLVRGPKVDWGSHPNTRRLLEPVANPKGKAFILAHDPLEDDYALAFLKENYVLVIDFEDRFRSLTTLPRRYYIGWPRYLYAYQPGG